MLVIFWRPSSSRLSLDINFGVVVAPFQERRHSHLMKSFLTLVIPTCNRPEFIDTAIRFFLASASENLSVIVCDASDNSQKTWSALNEFIFDSRFLYIDNTVEKNGRPVSMLDNWNTALDYVDSEWVAVIGDDDILDPSLEVLLKKIEEGSPEIESVRWRSAKASVVSEWNGEPITSAVKVSLGTKQHIADNNVHLEKILKWDTFPNVPQKLSGLYHGAVKMSLLRRLKERRGAWFKYQNLDFEIGWLISRETKSTFFCERPFSINGSSPKSNSWGVRRPEVSSKNFQIALDQGSPIDGYTSDFIEKYIEAGGEFGFFSMLPVAVFGTTIRFHDEYKCMLEHDTRINFSKILIARAYSMQDEFSFEWYLKNCQIFLNALFDKKVQYTQPIYVDFHSVEKTKVGLHGDELRIPRNKIPGTYQELAQLIFSMLPTVKV